MYYRFGCVEIGNYQLRDVHLAKRANQRLVERLSIGNSRFLHTQTYTVTGNKKPTLEN
jgi:hypothetical protein